jgi:hypothetical protein
VTKKIKINVDIELGFRLPGAEEAGVIGFGLLIV